LTESLFFFFVVEETLLSFVVFVGSVDQGVKGVVEVFVFDRLPNFFHHDQELLSDHVVDPEAE
jgi:hypothetical protein